MSVSYAMLRANGKVHRIFLLDLPKHREKDWYRNSQTYDAFVNAESRRKFPYLYGKGHLEPAPWGFNVLRKEDYDFNQQVFDEMCERYPQLGLKMPERGDGVNTLRWETDLFELTRFTSMFDFYKHIGYSYVRKKYKADCPVPTWLS